MDGTEHLLYAINVRNQIESGMQDRAWAKERCIEMIEHGFWSYPQIGTITKYPRQTVAWWARDCQRPAERPKGGALDAGSLDLLLELRGAVLRGSQPNPELLAEAIRRRNSTKLISRLTGIPLGVVLYRQRKMMKEQSHV